MRLQTTFALLRPSHRSPFAPSRYLATAAPPPPPPSAPPPPPSSPSGSSSFTGSLPPAVQAAFRTNPVLKKLIGDEITRRNMKAIGEAMYNSGIQGNGTGKPTAMEMTKLMMNSDLRVAIQGLTASMTRLGITMADLQPIMSELMAKGGLDGFAPPSTSPTSSTSSLSTPPKPTAVAAKSDPVMDAFKAKAELYREVVVEEEKLEEKEHEKEAKVDVEASTEKKGGLFSKFFGGGKK
ncbi:hypothetical protein BDY24DRAFT_388650 [Mrakia frigida]|uniref:uncharacterized protein n=1 Tax=Mrakia frigida TaxID=29902 RepID=UPI003FCC154A